MSWPTNLPNSAAFDADADSVAASRPELKKMSDAVNTMASNVYTAGSTTGTITPDVANGEIQRITLTGNITMNAFANPVAGQRLTMIFRQPAAGSTYDLSSNMLWENGLESLTQINGAVDTADIFYDGTNYFARMNLAHGSVEVYPFFGNPLTEDLDVNNFKIVNNVTNGNIVLQPNGTGDVQLNADTVRVGDSNANATITTNGTGDLILNTNSGTNSSTITINDGERGNIILQTDKTNPSANPLSMIRLNTNAVVVDNEGEGLTIGTPIDPATGRGKTLQIAAGIIQMSTGYFSGSPLPRIVLNNDGLVDITAGPGGNGYIHLNSDQIYLKGSLVTLGNATDATITTASATALILKANEAGFSASITLEDGSNGNINMTPHGTGAIVCSDKVLRQVEFKDYAETVYNQGNVTGSFSITVSNGNTQRMRLTGNITFTGFADAREGQTVTLLITQDGTGGRTFTEGLDSAGRMLFAGGVSTLSTGANAVDVMTISYIAGTYFASINKGYV